MNRRPGFLKLIATAFVVKCFNLKIRPEQKPIFFSLSFSSSSPCSFQMNSLPSFCRCFSGQCLGGGEEYVCLCVYVKRDFQSLRQETTPKKPLPRPVDSVTLLSQQQTSCMFPAFSLKSFAWFSFTTLLPCYLQNLLRV